MRSKVIGNLKNEEVARRTMVGEKDDSPHKVKIVPIVTKLIIFLINVTQNMDFSLRIRNKSFLVMVLIKEVRRSRD